ncbi:MAG: hypothetical protein ACRDSE_05560 [Pseudonocardiaceae bacterium]
MQMVEIANRSSVSYNGYLIATIAGLESFRDALIAVRDGKVQQDVDIASGYNKG